MEATQIIPQYVLEDKIGEGSFGIVMSGRHGLTGEKVAVKILKKSKMTEPDDAKRAVREIHIMAKMSPCPHIVQLFQVVETDTAMNLVLEYAARGELYDYVDNCGIPPEPLACKWIHQILAGVEWGHNLGVCHRDLKLENILLDENYNIKVADYGLSNTFGGHERLNTQCGSPCYAAPEMIAGNIYDPKKVDIWSCGIILYALLTGRLPFGEANLNILYKSILNAQYEVPENLNPDASDLIQRVLIVDPDCRLEIQQIRAHPWYRQIPEASLPAEPNNFIDEEAIMKIPGYKKFNAKIRVGLRANIRNQSTAAYKLYLQKLKREREAQEMGKVRARMRSDASTAEHSVDGDRPESQERVVADVDGSPVSSPTACPPDLTPMYADMSPPNKRLCGERIADNSSSAERSADANAFKMSRRAQDEVDDSSSNGSSRSFAVNGWSNVEMDSPSSQRSCTRREVETKPFRPAPRTSKSACDST